MRFFFFTDPATTEIYTLSLHDALPICRVVAACGDGGFLMTAHELETAHRLGVNIVAVVFHDNAYGSIKRKQLARFGRTSGVDFGNPDFVKLAEAFGVKGYHPQRA